MGRTKYFPTSSRNSQDNTHLGDNEDDQGVMAANTSTTLDSTSRRNENTASVEGFIELQEPVEPFSEDDEEANDNDLRSVQMVATQTSKAVVEASQHGRPTKKKRGNVCCRKLINLMPGEKLHVTFDKDCRPIGENSSLFTYFLGQTVRNRTCCPLGVPEWKNIEDHYIDFAWNVVLEKFTMDQPEMRKEFILRHMNALYRDYRRKLKAIYYDDPELINQVQREKNKPKNVAKRDWLYLCKLWHSPDFKRKKLNREPTRAEISIASRQRTSS
ncbi:uncharacterized protein LOC110709417 isoform X2 [Chenopodium quinoa]|uniref:uncharacterized protein LOC110709417 isoform X2 n=1 Tax=Chenopodium quinoa TaxID=63459 RepID=UPI000B78C76A|nr:uncharacterized protein LOC110709417 isoform X2 [Chenopodium quinoa]